MEALIFDINCAKAHVKLVVAVVVCSLILDFIVASQ